MPLAALTLGGVAIAIVAAANSSGYGVLGVLILAPVLTTIVAAPFAIASFVKRERPVWCSVIAAAISIGPTVFLVGAVVVKRMGDDAYQNRTLIVPDSRDVSGFVVERRRIELPTFALRTRRSPS